MSELSKVLEGPEKRVAVTYRFKASVVEALRKFAARGKVSQTKVVEAAVADAVKGAK